MEVFLLVALSALLLSLGAVVVAAVALRRSLRGLREAAEQARARIEPLTEELAAEQAVTALELEALQRGARARAGARGASPDSGASRHPGAPRDPGSFPASGASRDRLV